MKRFILFMVAIFMVTLSFAQFKNMSEATQAVQMHLEKEEGILEKNSLEEDKEQVCIPEQNTQYVETLVRVGILLTNGVYSQYYKHKEKINLTRNFWVFIPKEVQAKCKERDVKDSSRLCQFLGLDNKVERDTIAFFYINSEHLFRPAYNSDIKSVVTKSGLYPIINQPNDMVREWFKEQQKTNKCPWTRMGYTYDWGADNTKDKDKNKDEKYYIGATEFVTKNNTSVRLDGYQTVEKFLSEIKQEIETKKNEAKGSEPKK